MSEPISSSSVSFWRLKMQFEGAASHVLDFARVCLVFTDARALWQGLHEICAEFDTVSVRNYHRPSLQSLLGSRSVEVLVVLGGASRSCNLDRPHLCEIQLMEASFFYARVHAEGKLRQVRANMAHLLSRSRSCIDVEALAYLARWTATKPKQGHLLTVFRQRLRRRFGSLVAAWRLALDNTRLAKFKAFKNVCQQLNDREHTTEF